MLEDFLNIFKNKVLIKGKLIDVMLNSLNIEWGLKY